MRGRTNIVQRTGPTVIGNLVTRKQVTGSRIDIGNFVEFTGDTSTWETLSGPFNYQYSKSFEIMTLYSGSDVENVIFGVFYINPTSSQCKLIVADKNEVIKVTNLSGISFEGCTGITDVCLISNKLYVTITSSKKVYVFNYNSSNYSITYDSTITVTLPKQGDSSYFNYLIGVRGNYIYGYSRTNNSDNYHYFVRMNMDGSTAAGQYSFTAEKFSNRERGYNLYEADNYIFLFPSGDPYVQFERIIFNYSNNSVVVQSASVLTKGTELESTVTHLMFKKNDYFIMICGRGICVFYLDANMQINVVKYFTYSSSNYLGAIVENSGSDYRILICYFLSASNNLRFHCELYNFNSDSSLISEKDEEVFQYDNPKVSTLANFFLFDANDIYNIFFTNFSSTAANNLCKTKFVINNDTIVQTESLDLVKPYENTINGVAKTSGNVGQEISVYVP